MLESLLCNSCGAPLEVPASARFVKCNHCNTTLRVDRSSGGTTTEGIEKLSETTEHLARQVQKLTRQTELGEFDRSWEAERETFAYRDQQGGRHLPAQRFAWVLGTAIVFFGGLWTAFAIAITQSAPNEGPFAVAKVVFPLFGLGFIAFGVLTTVAVFRKARQYRDAQEAYQQERQRLLEGDE